MRPRGHGPDSGITGPPRSAPAASEQCNKNTAWLNVVTELRRLVESMSPTGSRSQAAVAASASATKIPLKYRVKKSFDRIDRDDFRSTAYETFRDFFEKSVKELDGIDDLRARYQSIGPTAFTCTVINGQMKRGRGGEAHITVHASPQAVLGEIYYSFSAHAPPNTANGGFSIDVDDYHPFVRPNDFADNNRSRTLSPQEAASRLWQSFIETTRQ